MACRSLHKICEIVIIIDDDYFSGWVPWSINIDGLSDPGNWERALGDRRRSQDALPGSLIVVGFHSGGRSTQMFSCTIVQTFCGILGYNTPL